MTEDTTVVVGGRRGGKTTRLVREVLDHPGRVLVVSSRALVPALEQQYPALRGRVFGADDVRDRLRGHQVELYVDNAEVVLRHMLGHWVAGLSVTGHVVDMDPSPV